MPTIIEDLERGHSINEILGEVSIQRVFHVSGLTAAPEAQLLEAIRDPGTPFLGDGYPNEPQWFVVNIDASPGGEPNSARLEYTYSNRQGPTWNQTPPTGNDGEDVKQFSGSVRPRRTTVDRNDTPMLLAPPPAYAGWPNYESEAEMQDPIGELVFERVETTNPAVRWRTHGGTVNVSPIGAYGAEQLLFARLDAQSNDGGRTWNVVYRFQYDGDQWLHVDFYHAPDGKVPDGATGAAFNVQKTSDFSLLNLDFSDSQTPI